MFIMLLHYKKPLELIDAHLAAHRAFLKEGYSKQYFIVSGPQKPRTGGVVISPLRDRAQLEAIMKQDPFCLHDVAEYQLIEFEPVMCDDHFRHFCHFDEGQ